MTRPQRYEIAAKGQPDGPYLWMPVTRNPETGNLRIATVHCGNQGAELTQAEASQLIRMCTATNGYFYRIQRSASNGRS